MPLALKSLPLSHHEHIPTLHPPSPSGRSVKGRGPQCLEPFTAVNRTWESPMWLSPRHTHKLTHIQIVCCDMTGCCMNPVPTSSPTALASHTCTCAHTYTPTRATAGFYCFLLVPFHPFSHKFSFWWFGWWIWMKTFFSIFGFYVSLSLRAPDSRKNRSSYGYNQVIARVQNNTNCFNWCSWLRNTSYVIFFFVWLFSAWVFIASVLSVFIYTEYI